MKENTQQESSKDLTGKDLLVIYSNDVRPNYSENFEETEEQVTIKSLKNSFSKDDFYILEKTSQLALGMPVGDCVNNEAQNNLMALKTNLLEKDLLPSQNGNPQMPLIVHFLNTNVILIQEPKHYELEVLKKLKSWNHGKVILLVNESDSNSADLKNLMLGGNERLWNADQNNAQMNTEESQKDYNNLIVVTKKGQVYTKGKNHDLEYSGIFKAALNSTNNYQGNTIKYIDFQFLMALQEALLNSGLIQKKEQSHPAAIENLSLLGQIPTSASFFGNKRTYNKKLARKMKRKMKRPKAGGWINNKKKKNRKKKSLPLG